MKLLQTVKVMLGFTQTKIGIVFAICVPLIFLLFWMTGYDHATDRVENLKVVIVNEDGEGGVAIQKQVEKQLALDIVISESYEESKNLLGSGEYSMMIVIPRKFSQNISSNQEAKLTFYINQASPQVEVSIAESAAAEITSSIEQNQNSSIDTEIIKNHKINNFATTLLPLVLGFTTYIAVMTMNINFNIVTQIMKKSHSKWQIFWGKQLLLIFISILMATVLTSIALLFNNVASSFLQLWFYQVIVTLACISFTQMTISLLGNGGPLFNVAMIPLQLMTAGNIVPTTMLTPIYRNIGHFLPVPNGVEGFTTLIYTGNNISNNIVNLLLIIIVTFVITTIRISLQNKKISIGKIPANQSVN